MEYAGDILRRLKEQGIHTAIETNGFFPWDRFSDAILPNVDLIMIDVKLADPGRHREYTGESNTVIMENLRRIAVEYPSLLLPRVPLIPGFTATTENLAAIGSLFRTLGLARYVLLPYNPTWFHKAAALGKPVDKRLPVRMSSPEGERGMAGAASRLIACRPHPAHGLPVTDQTSGEREKRNDSEKVHGVQARSSLTPCKPRFAAILKDLEGRSSILDMLRSYQAELVKDASPGNVYLGRLAWLFAHGQPVNLRGHYYDITLVLKQGDSPFGGILNFLWGPRTGSPGRERVLLMRQRRLSAATRTAPNRAACLSFSGSTVSAG